MTITKAEPQISELSEEEVVDIEGACEYHLVPFGSLSVDAFHEGALIREAVAQYWAPEYTLGTSGGASRDSALSQIMWNVFPQGLLQCHGRSKTDFGFLVEVRIILTYPLHEYWEATVKIPANRIGEVFAIAYDIYKHIYDLDNSEWQSEGHQDAAPRGRAAILNRASGKYVWGHDMRDLVFESIGFLVNPEWAMSERHKIKIIDEGEEAEKGERFKSEPESEHVLAPLSTEEHGSTCPLLGTFVFGIGS